MKPAVTIAMFLAVSGVPPLAAPAETVAIAATESYIHEPSRFLFPLAYGKFTRGEVTVYDDAGNDVSVGYNLDSPKGQIALTIYVYPPATGMNGSPLSLDEQFRQEVATLLANHSDAALSSAWTPPKTQNAESMAGHAMTFRYTGEFAHKSQKLESLLYLFEYDGWRVKYRITYPLSQREFANLLAQVFVSAFRWRGGA